MKKDGRRRTYQMTARAEAAARTRTRILGAASQLWREGSLDEITLQAIAVRAGVTVQTVIRRFGSKEGVVAAAIEADAAGIRRERDQAVVGDVDSALQLLLEHYERDGDAVIRTLALEQRVPAAQAIAEAGRSTHREWCARVFGPWLPAREADTYGVRLDAFVAATDLYLWKLLRRDLGRSPEGARQVFRALVEGLLVSSPEIA